MSLTAYPFDTTTGELLPVYRDAYLRGDLSREHTALVDAHLKKHASLGNETWQRFHDMQLTGENVQAVGWMQRQINLVRTSPQRVRRQAASLVAVAALIGGAVFANTAPATKADTADTAAETTVEAAGMMRMTTVRGKILDENGRPLIGATVLDKVNSRGVTTDAEGNYAMLVPVDQAVILAYGYGGYTGEDIKVNGKQVENVTLVPNYESRVKPARKAKRWFAFN
ncbi:carboxypeptidase-like regulatory domain-containing protein [Hymenobacter arizonensis]|uniref:CarboxypepD_reg-like domain-containing protein n=1 Tax=Hymenobacter arizonensis TaxID=1227077 RepID=A0A1I5X7Q0_HYMAR|nr:carboxypeptidase-like regulatory domain-containing protein [Hymenobacter arizonensis]SFQ27964.1 CarboxypepD_reg-like domain-containing protein [Hymenobacter arizonensis]